MTNLYNKYKNTKSLKERKDFEYKLITEDDTELRNEYFGSLLDMAILSIEITDPQKRSVIKNGGLNRLDNIISNFLSKGLQKEDFLFSTFFMTSLEDIFKKVTQSFDED